MLITVILRKVRQNTKERSEKSDQKKKEEFGSLRTHHRKAAADKPERCDKQLEEEKPIEGAEVR